MPACAGMTTGTTAMNIGEIIPDFNDPIGVLESCHRRVERHLRALTRAGRLILVGRGGDKGVAEGLETALRYFAVAGPLHTRDEEESLIPRLRAHLKKRGGHSDYLLQHLESDHREAEKLHTEVAALGNNLVITLRLGRPVPADHPDLAAYRRAVAELRVIYEPHILVEERDIYPAAREVLTPDEIAAIGREMAARRGLSVTQSPVDFMRQVGVA